MAQIIPGVCRHCSCADERPCGYCKGVHGGSAWTNSDRVVCSNPPCIRAEAERVSASRFAKRSPYKGWGYGAIVNDLRKRKGRGRKGKAA